MSRRESRDVLDLDTSERVLAHEAEASTLPSR